MSRLESALKRLAEGAFICEHSYPDEFEVLQSEEGRRKADEWLGMIGYRLARLTDEGAFFMAHGIVSLEMRANLREEMRNVREMLEPYVGFMEVLRQAQGRDPQLHPGDQLWMSEILEAVRTNSMLARRLEEMRDMPNARITDTAADRVRRLLERLVKDGYLVQTNEAMQGFQITGKINYLYQLMSFIAENTSFLTDDSVVDQVDPQARLDVTVTGTSEAGLEGAQPGSDSP